MVTATHADVKPTFARERRRAHLDTVTGNPG
jgi:hypothetical protein